MQKLMQFCKSMMATTFIAPIFASSISADDDKTTIY